MNNATIYHAFQVFTASTTVLVLAACAGAEASFTRDVAGGLLEASLTESGPTKWSGGMAECPAALSGAMGDPRRLLSGPIEVTGVTGEGIERTATFSVRITGLERWTAGQGQAAFQRYDDGWRLEAAYLDNCSQ